jgi:hypothetical protein
MVSPVIGGAWRAIPGRFSSYLNVNQFPPVVLLHQFDSTLQGGWLADYPGKVKLSHADPNYAKEQKLYANALLLSYLLSLMVIVQQGWMG